MGETAISTVPAFTILSFTGNNIAPKGDLASRSLMARLDVDRPDPENRPFRHSDPIAWTLDNRGKILRALYVLLLANPQLTNPQPPKTRFKRWWHLVGSAVEHAAEQLSRAEQAKTEQVRSASTVDFVKLFASVEGEDEEGAVIADVLEILYETFPQKFFQASEVAKLINDPMTGEEEKADRLKAYFDQGGRKSNTVSALSVGRRLATMVDVPLAAAGRVFKLTRHQPKNQAAQRHVALYTVQVVG